MLQEDKMDIKKLTEDKVDKFKRQGYIHLENVIESSLLAHTRNRAIKLKLKYQSKLGEQRHNGSGTFWGGLELASTLDPSLWKSYTSVTMYRLSKTLLGTEPYLFNDQVVVKSPNEDFKFDPHTDNMLGPDPAGALEGKFQTINFCQILTNMTDLDVGPLSVLNAETNNYDTILASAGDIVAIDGNTLHASTANVSNKMRALYACVYSSHAIGDFQEGFYNEAFAELLGYPKYCSYI